MEISRLLMQSGRNYFLYSHKNKDCEKKYYLKNPKLKEIITLEEKEIGLYYKYLYLLTSTSLDLADILLCEAEIWYEDISSEWGFFLERIISDNCKKSKIIIENKSEFAKSEIVVDRMLVNDDYRDALNFFFNTKGEYAIWNNKSNGNKDINNICLLNLDKYKIINDDNIYILEEESFKLNSHFYNIMVEVLKKINWINNDYDFLKGGTKYAKKYILKQNYKDRKKSAKIKIDLSSIISSLVAKGIRYDDILNYPVYMIYDLYYRFVKIDECENTMTALYSGCIDTKKHPVNMDKINWAAIIE